MNGIEKAIDGSRKEKISGRINLHNIAKYGNKNIRRNFQRYEQMLRHDIRQQRNTSNCLKHTSSANNTTLQHLG